MDTDNMTRSIDSQDDDVDFDAASVDVEEEEVSTRRVNPFILPSDEEIFSLAQDPAEVRSRRSVR